MITHRPRRLRQTGILRDLVAETRPQLPCMVQPYFLSAKADAQENIPGFTGIQRLGVDPLSRAIEQDRENGLRSFLLFGYSETKDETGSASRNNQEALPHALRSLRERFGKAVTLFTDVCLCPYTSHGHCGILNDGVVENDASVSLLAEMALVHAQAGADFVAPSDMMDGRIGAIREKLDTAGQQDVGILAYTAKYASQYYGPFRGALDSSPKSGDRSTYQMDFRNRKEALRELKHDAQEGADIVMVKPALAYLDIIQAFKANSDIPVAAYSVSGEYEMVKLLAKAGMADETKLAIENLTAITRAGADIVVSYFATQAAKQRWFN